MGVWKGKAEKWTDMDEKVEGKGQENKYMFDV